MVGIVKKLPVVVTTIAEVYARIGPMINSHMIGKITPGGVHDGITRSRKPADDALSPPLIALDMSGR